MEKNSLHQFSKEKLVNYCLHHIKENHMHFFLSIKAIKSIQQHKISIFLESNQVTEQDHV